MAKAVSIPHLASEDLTPDERVQYVQDLWDYVVADASKVPVPDWHRRILDERLAEYRAAPHEREPWPQVRDQLLRELAERKRGEISRCPKSLSVPEAQADIREAALWHESRRPGLGSELTLRFDALIERIAQNPFQFPEIESGVRRALLRRFPYAIYFVAADCTIVIARSASAPESYHVETADPGRHG